jgi:hypothetical protein
MKNKKTEMKNNLLEKKIKQEYSKILINRIYMKKKIKYKIKKIHYTYNYLNLH